MRPERKPHTHTFNNNETLRVSLKSLNKTLPKNFTRCCKSPGVVHSNDAEQGNAHNNTDIWGRAGSNVRVDMSTNDD